MGVNSTSNYRVASLQNKKKGGLIKAQNGVYFNDLTRISTVSK